MHLCYSLEPGGGISRYESNAYTSYILGSSSMLDPNGKGLLGRRLRASACNLRPLQGQCSLYLRASSGRQGLAEDEGGKVGDEMRFVMDFFFFVPSIHSSETNFVGYLRYNLMPPNPDLLVLASTAHPITIRTPVDSKDLVFVAGKILLELAGPYVPDLECGVFTAADQQPTVSAECDLVNGAHMAFEGEEKGAVGSVPELDEIVEAGRGKKQPVG